MRAHARSARGGEEQEDEEEQKKEQEEKEGGAGGRREEEGPFSPPPRAGNWLNSNIWGRRATAWEGRREPHNVNRDVST